MLITRTNPSGIDLYIQNLQTDLHTKLISANYWNLADSTKYKAYGRCYRNKTADGYIAENYESSNQYREVYWDDTLTAISFFGMSNRVDNGIKYEADVHFVMFANLSTLALTDHTGAAITHRADEELRNMVLGIIGKSAFGFQLESVELWLENVLREYPGSRRDNRLIAVDMHPVHCFRINLRLYYDPKKNC